MPQTRAGEASTTHSMARNAIPEDGSATRTGTYNKIRGERVVARGRAMLDESVPLARGSRRDVVSYLVEGTNLLARLRNGTSTGLARPAQFESYRGEASTPAAVLLRNRGLHLEIKIDRGGLVGRDDPAGIPSLAALLTIPLARFRPRRCSWNSTTTARASSYTWCAGSIRA
jgi:Malate synthase G, alpha-beta insertion domain